MFGLFRRSRPASSSRTPAFVEGLEGRSMMSIAPLAPGSEVSLLPAVHTSDVPAVQHGLLLPAVHTTSPVAGTVGGGQTGHVVGMP